MLCRSCVRRACRFPFLVEHSFDFQGDEPHLSAISHLYDRSVCDKGMDLVKSRKLCDILMSRCHRQRTQKSRLICGQGTRHPTSPSFLSRINVSVSITTPATRSSAMQLVAASSSPRPHPWAFALSLCLSAQVGRRRCRDVDRR